MSLLASRSLRFSSIFKNTVALQRSYSSTEIETAPVADRHGSTQLQPMEHTQAQKGLLYTIPEEIRNTLLKYEGIPQFYQPIVKAFNELKVLIREPALEVTDYIRNADYSKTPNRYIIYGEKGTGKSFTVMHLAHLVYDMNFIMFYEYCPTKLMRDPGELLPSILNEDLLDHTIPATHILQKFADINGKKIKEFDLKTSKTYEWNQRESTPEGVSIMELIEFGIHRAKYASIVFYHLVEEMKLAATEGKCRVAVVFDGINMLFVDKMSWRRVMPIKSRTPQAYTIFQAYKLFLNRDWTNGLILGGTDARCNHKTRRKYHLPRYLLKSDGWTALNPFIPVQMENFTEAEFNQIYDYYSDKQWLQHPNAGLVEARHELEFISARNPRAFLDVTYSR